MSAGEKEWRKCFFYSSTGSLLPDLSSGGGVGRELTYQWCPAVQESDARLSFGGRRRAGGWGKYKWFASGACNVFIMAQSIRASIGQETKRLFTHPLAPLKVAASSPQNTEGANYNECRINEQMGRSISGEFPCHEARTLLALGEVDASRFTY